MGLFRTASPARRAHNRLMGRLRRRLILARAALLWEVVWPAFWPAILIAGIGVALALFDVLPFLPGAVHAILLFAWILALVVAIIMALRSIRFPERAAARRRVEKASGLGHRPLQLLEDRPAERDLEFDQRLLWRAHRRRMLATLKRLRVGRPIAGLARRDPYGLRIVLAIALLIGFVDARGDIVQRFESAVSPDMSAFAPPPVSLDLWVTPPAYTGLPPVVLRQMADKGWKGTPLGKSAPDAGTQASTQSSARTRPEDGAQNGAGAAPATARVPVGSTLLAQVQGGSGTPVLTLNGKEVDFQHLGEEGYKATGQVRESGPVVVRQGARELASIDLDVIPDSPPSIRFTHPPSATNHGVLRVDYAVKDDYGVTGAKLVIERKPPPSFGVRDLSAPGWSDPNLGAEDGKAPGAGVSGPRVEIPISTAGEPDETLTTYQDLTANPWAGLEVNMWLEAKDAAGQTGRSAVQKMILPERPFTNPVAREIIAARKKLARSMDARSAVAQDLVRIDDAPERFNGDPVVYLALRSALGRLILDPDPDAVPSVMALLWDTALRLEDAGVTTAEEHLRKAEKALQDALDHGAPPDEIEKRLKDVRYAMNDYLDALSRQIARPSQQGEAARGKEGVQEYQRSDLQKMLDRVRELARNGDAEGARRALAELRNVLENLQTPKTQQNAASAKAQKAMQKIQDIAQRQQKLLDQSFRASNPPSERRRMMPHGFPLGLPPYLLPPGMVPPGMEEAPPMQGPMPQQGQQQGQMRQQPQGPSKQAQGQPGESGPPSKGQKGAAETPDFAKQAQDQEALRHELGDVMLQLGEALGKIPSPLGKAELAMRDATKALQNSKPGDAVPAQQRALEQLQQGMQSASQELSKAMQRTGQGRAQAQGREDPLGRPMRSEGADTGNVHIPERMEIQKAREILDELRRRSGETSRPAIERDYIDRLIPRF